MHKEQIEQAAEKIRSLRLLQKRQSNYRYALSKIINCSGTSAANAISNIRLSIERIQNDIDIIMNTIGELEDNNQTIIRLWYFDKQSTKDIMNALYISSVSGLYKRRDKALMEFYNTFPW